MDFSKNYQLYFRIVHRYLGFFLAGIMTVYAISGFTLIYRNTDFLKVEKNIEKVLKSGLSPETLEKELKIRNLKVNKTEENVIYFEKGTYNSLTGEVKYISKELPFILAKFTKLHKTSTNEPLHWFNIFFALSLLFFVISAFFMFKPKSSHFKNGMYFTLAGLLFTIILLFLI